jgi:four helix bundle protein
MAPDELKKRTKSFAISVLKIVQALPDKGPVGTIGGQLLRAGTSVGSNFRAACRARSRADFIAKLKIVEEECDESIYWLELLNILNLKTDLPLRDLMEEADQILAIVVASIKTARAKL